MLQIEKNKTAEKIKDEVSSKAVKWYSEDELNNEIISAYQNFEKNLKDGIKDKFEKKLNISKEISEKIYTALNQVKGIACKKIYLRATSLLSFDVIIVIPEKVYLSEKFTHAYKIAFDSSKAYQKDSFIFDFSFMPSTRGDNTHALMSDGYYYSLEPIKFNESKN